MRLPGVQAVAAIVRLIDRVVIRMARLHLEQRVAGVSCPAEVRSIPVGPDFFGEVKPLESVDFSGPHDFTCDSPVPGVAPVCRRIHGKFYRCGNDWQKRPVVIMLHGWNGENCYRFLFPLLAWQCRRQGISLLSFQLPCHGKRRAPSGIGNDFISPDVSAMICSTRQAIADTRALIGWLKQEGCGRIGIWGISLGGWLAGLLACHDDRLSFAVLMSPIVRMDRAIAELEFCAPIRRSLAGREITFAGLNLTDHRPLVDRQNLLLVAGRHDLFAPRAWLEELWEAWNRPPIERFDHGHISILISLKAMMRVLRFITHSSGGLRKTGGAGMILRSDAFENNGIIPQKYSCKGQDINPGLTWDNVPEKTKSFALSVKDPDAPRGTFVHWLVYDIAKAARKIEVNSTPGKQVENSFGKKSYGGPCPPSGVHRYYFSLFALDIESLGNVHTMEEFDKKVTEHTIEQAEVMGKFAK